MKAVKSVEKLVLEESKDWNEFDRLFIEIHVKVVVDYAMKLADILGGDKEVVEISAWLHDHTISTHGNDDHHILGAKNARKILEGMGYPEEKIKNVCHSIESHRCKNGFMPKTTEAKILASADAMAHLDMLLFFPWIGKMNKQTITETFKWMKEKMDRDWNRKIFFPEARQLVQHKYNISKEILENHCRLLGIK